MSKFYATLAILTGIFIYWWVGLPSEEGVSYSEDGKTAYVTMDNKTTKYDVVETYKPKENRASTFDHRWVKIVVERNCYPTIKQDLKAGLKKFGYYHKETDKLIYKKCIAYKVSPNNKKLDDSDKELMELVK